MSGIQKINELKNVGEVITKFFNNHEYDSTILPIRTFETIACFGENDKDVPFIKTPEECSLKIFNEPSLIDDLNDVIRHLKGLYDIHYIWAVMYPPNDGLKFHADDYQRYILTFNSNNRFFNYEIDINVGTSVMIKKYNRNLDNTPIDEFNTNFINQTGNKIESLDELSIYGFGNSIHNFRNASDKVRFILVFDIY